jgi:arylsulfatase A-like enzyme
VPAARPNVPNAPNVLVIMTDEERYPPPYETEPLAEFRRTRLPARERLRARSVEFHRHYAGSTACLPSRATLFTGQYPSLHGVTNTDGLAKQATDPAMTWLDPSSVPTMGDWFRAGGYRTHYRGKWHISHADLLVPGTHERLATNDAQGAIDDTAVDVYRRADRLDPFGFSGWIGREPHGVAKSDGGLVKDPLYAEQVATLFATLAAERDGTPWLAVASFVNPHDIAFSGWAWENLLGYEGPGPSVPDIAPAPSQSDSLAGRPTAQLAFRELWPQVLYDQPTDNAYRRLYHHLIELVDAAILRILDALDASGMADDTVVVFTSDHGDLLGAHGGLLQKWHNAYDEAIRVPFLVSGPMVDATRDRAGVGIATSHVDVIPTLLGLVGIDVEAAGAEVARTHVETQPLPGRDLSSLLTRSGGEAGADAPIYFMTEDEITRGLRTTNLFTKEAFEPVGEPAKVESVVASLPTGADGTSELWKLNHYYERLDDWRAAHGYAGNPFAAPAAEEQWELHNLTVDPEERDDRAADRDATSSLSRLRSVLEAEREAKRLVPLHRNPTAGL